MPMLVHLTEKLLIVECKPVLCHALFSVPVGVGYIQECGSIQVTGLS